MRTDIFSVGIILYQLLTGILPRWKNKRIAPSEKFEQLPDQLQKMVNTMVAWSPAARQKTINEVLVEIDILLEYQLQLDMEEAKTQQWENQQAIENALKEQKQARLKKIIRWALIGSGLFGLICAGVFYQDILFG